MSESSSEEYDEDTTLASQEVISKYKEAGRIANKTLVVVMQACQVGASVVEVCEAGDAFIADAVSKVYAKDKSMTKGVAFPTSVSLNHCCGHFSPLSTDKTTIQEGDVVTIDIGVQVDGYISSMAHTMVATANPAEPIVGPKADVICAAHFAGEAALRLLRPGYKNTQVTEALQGVAKEFGVNVVEGVLSHQMKRYVIDGNKTIISKADAETDVEEVTFEELDVWCIDVCMSTGAGAPKPGSEKTTIFKRAPDESYRLKGQAARKLFSAIDSKYPVLPFGLRQFHTELGSRGLLGMKEILEHDLVYPYPVLFEKEGDLVARFKFTVLILPGSINKVNQGPLPYVQSDKSVQDPGLKQILAMGVKRKKNRRKKKKKPQKAQQDD